MSSVKNILIALVIFAMASTSIYLTIVDVTSNYGRSVPTDILKEEDYTETVELITDMEDTFRDSGAEMEEAGESDIGIFKAGVAVTTLMSNALGMATTVIWRVGGLLLTPGYILAGIVVIVAIVIFFYVFGIFFRGARD